MAEKKKAKKTTGRPALTGGELLTWISRRGACFDARDWVEGNRQFTAKTLWEHCNRADWLLGLIEQTVGYQTARRATPRKPGTKVLMTHYQIRPSTPAMRRRIRSHVNWRAIEAGIAADLEWWSRELPPPPPVYDDDDGDYDDYD